MRTAEEIVDKEVLYDASEFIWNMEKDSRWSDALRDLSIRNEIYEWWIVTDWLFARLSEQNEYVVNFLGLTLWGRTSTNQPIYIDDVMESIVNKIGDEHENCIS